MTAIKANPFLSMVLRVLIRMRTKINYFWDHVNKQTKNAKPVVFKCE